MNRLIDTQIIQANMIMPMRAHI